MDYYVNNTLNTLKYNIVSSKITRIQDHIKYDNRESLSLKCLKIISYFNK